MAFHVRDEATDQAVRRLAKLKEKTLTEAIREACEHEYERSCEAVPWHERLRSLHEWIAARSKPGAGPPADKAFYDELSGEEELTGLP